MAILLGRVLETNSHKRFETQFHGTASFIDNKKRYDQETSTTSRGKKKFHVITKLMVFLLFVPTFSVPVCGPGRVVRQSGPVLPALPDGAHFVPQPGAAGDAALGQEPPQQM